MTRATLTIWIDSNSLIQKNPDHMDINIRPLHRDTDLLHISVDNSITFEICQGQNMRIYI